MTMIETKLERIISSSLKNLGLDVIKFDLNRDESNQGRGDYATNVALVSFSHKGSRRLAKNSFELAKEIVKEIEKLASSEIKKVEAVAPGFINFYLIDQFFIRVLSEVIKKGSNFGKQTIGQGKTVVIDYSAPNIAKPFGIGHLRSTIIGQALYNIFTFLGYQTIGDNHLGDWGTQFGTLLYQIKIKKLDPQELTIKDLEKLYVDFHQKLKKEPKLKEEARNYFKRLESGEIELKQIWQNLVDLSLVEYKKIYQLLKVDIDIALGESFYLDKMGAVLVDAKNKGLVVKSQKALIMPLEDVLVPAMLVKSDGATTYLLRDLATIKYRIGRWQPELIIYEVGADQLLYFDQVFEAAEKLGYVNRKNLIHVAHGMIRGSFGKLSTREGKTIHLEEVLREAIKRAKQLSKKSGIAEGLSTVKQAEVVRMVGIGAVKYNDLKQNPRTDIVFDWEKILSLEGNSGPYLQYTYARTQSLLEKANKEVNLKKVPEYQLKKEELAIVRLICYFEGVIAKSARTFSPNLITNFIYQLARDYNTFYGKYQVLADDQEARHFRLLLTKATAIVLKNGLGLLGIETPKKM